MMSRCCRVSVRGVKSSYWSQVIIAGVPLLRYLNMNVASGLVSSFLLDRDEILCYPRRHSPFCSSVSRKENRAARDRLCSEQSPFTDP